MLQAAIIVYGDKVAEGHLVRALSIPWWEIIRELDRDPNFMYKFGSRGFEELIAAAYKREGWSDQIGHRRYPYY